MEKDDLIAFVIGLIVSGQLENIIEIAESW